MTLILSGTDGLSDVDGSAATPAIRGTDANTGIFFPAADTIAFSEGGTEAMRIDSSGNVGVGATPSAWGSTAKAVQLPYGCAIANTGAGDVSLTQNAYFDNPNYKYASTTGVGSSVYRQIDGTHRWSYSASGTAGNNITFTEAMRIDSSGNVGIGTSSPNGKLDVAVSAGINLALTKTGGAYLSFCEGTTTRAAINGLPSADGLVFATGSALTERARIDSNSMTLSALRILISGASSVPAPINNGDGNVGTYAQYGLTLIGKGTSHDLSFWNKNGSIAGYVATGATTITTSSDERLKENNQPITGALDIVCQMRHETGNYKSDPDRTVAFLIAQDVDALFPYAVEKADPESWGVNYNWIIPLHGAAITELTALVKEQQAIIQTLTDRITALETPTGTQA